MYPVSCICDGDFDAIFVLKDIFFYVIYLGGSLGGFMLVYLLIHWFCHGLKGSC